MRAPEHNGGTRASTPRRPASVPGRIQVPMTYESREVRASVTSFSEFCAVHGSARSTRHVHPSTVIEMTGIERDPLVDLAAWDARSSRERPTHARTSPAKILSSATSLPCHERSERKPDAATTRAPAAPARRASPVGTSSLRWTAAEAVEDAASASVTRATTDIERRLDHAHLQVDVHAGRSTRWVSGSVMVDDHHLGTTPRSPGATTYSTRATSREGSPLARESASASRDSTRSTSCGSQN